MWRMLTGRATDLEIELREHDAGEDSGSAHWIARYTFSTGRPVVNDIQATFRFADGLIADHVDEFDFRRWARQALGPTGLAVATLPPLRKAAAPQSPRPARRVHAGRERPRPQHRVAFAVLFDGTQTRPPTRPPRRLQSPSRPTRRGSPTWRLTSHRSASTSRS